MSIQNGTIRGSGMAQQNGMPTGGGYRYHKIPGWNPAVGLPAKAPRPVDRSRLEKLARIALFAKFREAGMSVTEASKAVGVHRETGRQYERELRAGRTS